MTEKQLAEGQGLVKTIRDLQERRNKIVEALNDNRKDCMEVERIFMAMLHNLDYTRIENEMKSLAERIAAELDSEIISLRKKN